MRDYSELRLTLVYLLVSIVFEPSNGVSIASLCEPPKTDVNFKQKAASLTCSSVFEQACD